MFIAGVDADSKQFTAVLLRDGRFQSYLRQRSVAKTANERFRELGLSAYNTAFWMKEEQLDMVFIEEPLYIQSPHATVSIASVAAAITLCCLLNGVEYRFIKNNTWKKLVLGNGRASKEQIADFVKAFLRDYENINQSVTPDILTLGQHFFDACCIALAGEKLLREEQNG
jgi:Holliday junction resolvasome RuvABC endonuclease subunit